MKHRVILAASPIVEDRLAVRLAVHKHEDRVLLRRVEIARLDHPRIHHDPVSNVELQELGGLRNQWADSTATLGIVFQDTHRAMLRKFHEIDHRRRVERRMRMERPLAIGREVVSVSPRLVCGSHSLGIALSIQSNAIEVALRGVIRRREKVKPASPLIDRPTSNDVAGVLCEQRLRLAIARNYIRMSPTISLAEQHQRFASLNPVKASVGRITRIDPRRIRFLARLDNCSGSRVDEQNLTSITKTAQHFDEQFL